jgi:carboxymethylenebutenolidase
MALTFEKVKIVRNGDGKIEFDAYVMGKEGAPGIVVIQEWWGIDYEIKKHATDIASKGYRALIPEYV